MSTSQSEEKTEAVSTQAFANLGLAEPLLRGLGEMGWTEPSEVQAKLIPVALAGHDILGQARTGTGKTGAFGLPILQQLEPGEGVRCLILAPTRELAAQVAGELSRLAQFTPHKVVVAYGGTRVRQQATALKKNPAIVVGTPGRVMDLMQRRILSLDHIRFIVLDEVDRMLDIGFRDDIRKILSHVKTAHQTVFVSATIEEEINRLARRYMHEPVEVFCTPDKLTVDEVQQYYVGVQGRDKPRLLKALLAQEKPELAIVFTRMKRDSTRVARQLKDAGINAREIHGDLMQSKRDRIMKSFRAGSIHVLVATDLASRGIDVDAISHIINYDIPEDAEVYVHRIGRTARMGATGKAFTFVTPEQGGELTDIEMLINREVPEVRVEGFTPSPPEEAPPKPQAARPVSRLQAPVFGEPTAEPEQRTDGPRRTLGAKFRPSRRRRL